LKVRPDVERDWRQEPVFERFVAERSARLLRIAYLLTGDRGTAEDLLQITLLRTAMHWPAARRAPEAYARRVLVNLVRDRARRAARRVTELPLEDSVDARLLDLSADPSERMMGRNEVFGALARLPAEQREVLVLRFYGDLSVAETAAATGASAGTVKSRTNRALARMRELLGGPARPASQPTAVEIGDDG
jgi:RNA polymerase sigma-70 factor (sigma-E family)